MTWSLPCSREPELMDDPSLDADEHIHALRALATINAISRTAAQIEAAVTRIVPDPPPSARPLAITDIACGGGDITCDLARRFARRGIAASVVGLDRSTLAIDRARARAARRSCSATFAPRDLLTEDIPPCDVAVSSLFLHHLDDEHARRLLVAMARAVRHGIVVSDLIRSWLGLALAVVGTNVLSRSRIARIDGPLSVRASRTPTEYRALAASAGLHHVTIRKVWPERVMLVWRKQRTNLAEGRV